MRIVTVLKDLVQINSLILRLTISWAFCYWVNIVPRNSTKIQNYCGFANTKSQTVSIIYVPNFYRIIKLMFRNNTCHVYYLIWDQLWWWDFYKTKVSTVKHEKQYVNLRKTMLKELFYDSLYTLITSFKYSYLTIKSPLQAVNFGFIKSIYIFETRPSWKPLSLDR